jgi:hypothetical protein
MADIDGVRHELPAPGEDGGPPRPGRLGRRSLLLGAAAAGAGAAAAGVVTSAGPASAADGGNVVIGEDNSASATTQIQTGSGYGLQGITTQNATSKDQTAGVYGTDSSSGGAFGVIGASNPGTGVYGYSAANYAVEGYATGVYGDGVYGYATGKSGTGVYGYATGDLDAVGVYGLSINNYGVFGGGTVGVAGSGATGVLGLSSSDGAYGVQGEDRNIIGTGTGVAGTSNYAVGVYGAIGDGEGGSEGTAAVYGVDNTSKGAVGVWAYSGAGTALTVEGTAAFQTAGTTEVAGTSAKPKSSVKVTGVPLTSTSLVVATAQGHMSGVYVEGVVLDVSAGSFTIYLNKSITTSLVIGWFACENFTEAGPNRPVPRPRPPAHLRPPRPPRPPRGTRPRLAPPPEH